MDKCGVLTLVGLRALAGREIDDDVKEMVKEYVVLKRGSVRRWERRTDEAKREYLEALVIAKGLGVDGI